MSRVLPKNQCTNSTFELFPDRPTAGQQTLNLRTVVRIHVGEPPQRRVIVVRDYEKHCDLLSRTISMVRDFLMEEVYHDTDPSDLAKEWGTTYQHVLNLTTREPVIMHDLLQLLDFTSLDFGVVVRDPSTGKEVTFFAAENLASHLEHSTQTEEIQYYGSDKKGDDPLSDEEAGLDFLPRQHTILFGDKDEVIQQKLVECDGDFDVDKELGEDTIEAEFEELTQRDLEDFETKCENCLDEERLPGSMLCFHCDALGIECSPPEDPERPEDPEPLELLAVVDRQAQRTQHNSVRLLKAAGMLKGEN